MSKKINLSENLEANFNPPNLSRSNEKVIDEATDKEKSIFDYMQIIKIFLDYIENSDYSLKDKVIPGKNRAILLSMVNNVETDTYSIIAFCFNKLQNLISDVKIFDRTEHKSIEKYIATKILADYEMKRITTEYCSHSCEYYLENYELFFVGKDENLHKKVADFKKLAYLAVDAFDMAKKNGMKIETFTIKGKKYTAISNDDLKELWGKNYNKNYNHLALLNIPFIDDDNGVNRKGYRHKSFDEKTKKSDKRYFAVETEKLAELRRSRGLC